MGISEEWREVKYREIFEAEVRGLERRRHADPLCKVEDLEGILKSLYALDGADQDHRGELQDTIMSATVAAYEMFVAQWRAESV